MHLTNVVCRGELCCQINLREFTLKVENTRYDPKTFAGVIWKHKKIGGNCLLFSNGQMNCNEFAYFIRDGFIRQYARKIQKMGFDVHLVNVQMVTCSATHALSNRINVQELLKSLGYHMTQKYFPHLCLKEKEFISLVI